MPDQHNPRDDAMKAQAAERAPRVLDRAGRARKARKLKRAAAAAGLAGTAFFTGLIVQTGHASSQHGVVTPDQQLSQLEQANSGAFFSIGGTNVPSLGGGSAQTSSGGS
jgi:hypothetical protein